MPIDRTLKLMLSAISCMLAMTASSHASPPLKPIVVVFRYDDYSSRSYTPVDQRTITEFAKHKFQITMGVVPRECRYAPLKGAEQPGIPLPAEKVRILRAAGDTVDVALHGYTHQWLDGSLSEQSEFCGMPFADQRERIRKGKLKLERLFGKPITTFIPPFNRYDQNTAKVLGELGFTCLSAGLRSPAPTAPPRPKKYLPSTCSLGDLPNAVQEARRLGRHGGVIVVLMHNRDFAEANPWGTLTIPQMADILDWTARQSDLSVLSISQAAKTLDDCGLERLRAVQQRLDLPLVIPGRLRFVDERLYLTKSDAQRDVSRAVALTAACFAAIAAFSFTAAVVAGGLVRRFGLRRTYIISGIIALILFAAYFAVHRPVGPVDAAAALTGCGIYLGGLALILRSRSDRPK